MNSNEVTVDCAFISFDVINVYPWGIYQCGYLQPSMSGTLSGFSYLTMQLINYKQM